MWCDANISYFNSSCSIRERLLKSYTTRIFGGTSSPCNWFWVASKHSNAQVIKIISTDDEDEQLEIDGVAITNDINQCLN